MKQLIIIIAFLLMNSAIFAQRSSQQFPINISYYGHYIYQPGLKVGTTYTFKDWGNSKRTNQLSINPQIGFFFLPRTSTNLVLNTEIAHRVQKLEKTWYSIFSIGLGYMAESQFLGLSTNIGTGNTTKTEKDLNHFFMPTVNYEFGKEINERLDWFLKLSTGTKLSTQQASNMVVFTEFGIKYYLK